MIKMIKSNWLNIVIFYSCVTIDSRDLVIKYILQEKEDVSKNFVQYRNDSSKINI